MSTCLMPLKVHICTCVMKSDVDVEVNVNGECLVKAHQVIPNASVITCKQYNFIQQQLHSVKWPLA